MSSSFVTPPMFNVLEGIDGAGTTTQAERLVTHLSGLGRKAHGTREPSQGPIGLLLRDLLRGEHAPQPGRPVDGRTMALLFAADRIDHLEREIEPQLAAGYDVVARNDAVNYTTTTVLYNPGAEDAAQPLVARFHRVVWMGDLNYRIHGPRGGLQEDVPAADLGCKTQERLQRSLLTRLSGKGIQPGREGETQGAEGREVREPARAVRRVGRAEPER